MESKRIYNTPLSGFVAVFGLNLPVCQVNNLGKPQFEDGLRTEP